ncbi:DUF2460 domain-containing protein [Nitratireductor sp. OM-1]|uniref:DUF2460 domain-containing protein n=1 Tax=Nitratireductor sp. OM-1 TaxID=1756988 RepID=UPI000DDEE859|nr:DUF2460 domain-containing protein [Nitratireductor sp. OM-1]
MSGRITASWSGMMVVGEDSIHVTQNTANFLGRSSGHRRRITQVYAQIMGEYPLNTGEPEADGSNRFTQLHANVMVPFTPNFEWIDMVIDEVFPFDISYNSIGATRFHTDVVRVDSGHDQRSSRWSQPLMEYDIAYGVRTMEHLQGLIAFFRSMAGRRNAFLYHDHVDYTSTLAVDEEARRAPDISPRDQEFGVGDHQRYRFQLVKHYPTPSGQSAQTRPIYRPKPGSVQVAVGGLLVDNYVVDHERGIVEFIPNWAKYDLQSMRIEPDLDGNNQPNGRWIISGDPGMFTGLFDGDKIITRGWLNPANNSSETISLILTSVAGDGSSVTFTAPENYGELETNRNGVTVVRHPAPQANLLLTAGFEFYVPVRFDTDRLPISLEEYGVGGAADVKLIEVRPAEMFDE